MQRLFALHQCKDANYHLSIDHITRRFTPDLNSNEVQDKALLSSQKTEAKKLFENAFIERLATVEHTDSTIQRTVNDSIELYTKQCKKDTDLLRKTLVTEVERIYHHYISLLNLSVSFAELAHADKKVVHSNFVNNQWIKALQSSETLKKESQRLGKTWNGKMEKARIWFRDVIRLDNEYLVYLDKKKPGTDEQKKFANYFFRKLILGKNTINDQFEEDVLQWAEDKEIVKGLLEKTIKSYTPGENNEITIYTLSTNWEEDREFLEILYSKAADLEQPYKDLIAANTRNWEVDRLPLTDKIILEMAISELLNFSNVPVKVTINEYIELAKQYSTPKSRQFINGILDVIARELKEQGAIKKSGRGLIDNK